MYFNLIEFGKRMQSARKERGLTQEELADLLGVNRTHITKIERGNRACSVDFLVELASVLHVTTDYLLIGTEQISIIKESLEEAIWKLQNIVDTINSTPKITLHGESRGYFLSIWFSYQA